MKRKEVFIIKKENGELKFKNIDGFQSRNISTFRCIYKADLIYKWNNFPEMLIYTGDSAKNERDYTFSRNEYYRLVPDFNFDSWPEIGINDYTQMTETIEKEGRSPATLSKVGWIGSTKTNKMREKMMEIGKNHDLFDFFDTRPGKTTAFIPLPDLVKTYEWLIDIEGYGYSGRLKYLLWSHRPVLLVDRPYKEFFFEFLKEWVHYIPVKRDLSDLIEKTTWCIENKKKAEEIAENAFEFSKIYLTRESCYKQWNKIIKEHINNFVMARPIIAHPNVRSKRPVFPFLS
jgi:hypothetical protein